ncbi:MAG: FKBP-type peptidyl-prolyl cis-trans isomerase [Thermodesulfobacteriota bacterium]
MDGKSFQVWTFSSSDAGRRQGISGGYGGYRFPSLFPLVPRPSPGTFTDGTELDSSHKRGKPTNFQVAGVIPGWTEALQLMKEGTKWQFFMRSELAYGERGMGRIPANSTLIFGVELIFINEIRLDRDL